MLTEQDDFCQLDNMKLFSKTKKSKSKNNVKKKEEVPNINIHSNTHEGVKHNKANGTSTSTSQHDTTDDINRTSSKLEEERNNPGRVAQKADPKSSNSKLNSNSTSSPQQQHTNDDQTSDANKEKHDSNNENGNNDIMNDPTAFWLAWNERKQACFDNDGNILAHKAGCNCFEGMGSVM